MKKLIAVAALAVVAAATGVAAAGNRPQRVTEAQVQAAIDARLHQMLVSMNAQHAAR